MYGQYTHYLLVDTSKIKTRISTRYDWNTYTYKDVEKTGTRKVNATLPTDDNLKSEIETFMSDHSISGSGTKAELLEAINAHILENGHPQIDESYKYTDKEVDTTTKNEATLEDMINNKPTYFAKRESPDGSEFVVKTDFTLAELNALGTGFTVYTNEEIKSYIADNWDYDE